MKIKRIRIENFRCFEHYDLSFADCATVIIGKNGSGKTTLLHALKGALSFIFSKYSNKNEALELIGSNAQLRPVNLRETDAFFDAAKRAYQYPVRIYAEGTLADQPLPSWAIVKNSSGGKLQEASYREAFLAFTRTYNQQTAAKLPVLAYYSDSYPHKQGNMGSYAKKVLKSGMMPRAFGYYQWESETSFAEIWKHRYVAQYTKINDFKRDADETLLEQKEVSFIDEKLRQFTSPLNEVHGFINQEFEISKIVVERPLMSSLDVAIKFIFQDKREIFFEHLPQGYNRLISIVLDIAYRGYLLNGPQEPAGIVMIDEPELHLHPTLQQEVLQRFRKTFPEIQFIVATHSPLLISNLKDDTVQNKIIRMEQQGDRYSYQEIENIFGLDYSTNLAEVMEVAPRSSTIDKYMNAYLFLFGKGQEDRANEMYEKLRVYVGGKIPTLLQEEIDTKKKLYQHK